MSVLADLHDCLLRGATPSVRRASDDARTAEMRTTLGPHLEPEDIAMKVLLSELKQPRGSCWQVRMDQHAVSFRSEAEARAFIATLEARLQAPHGLPQARVSNAG